jgi:hypothetical protein
VQIAKGIRSAGAEYLHQHSGAFTPELVAQRERIVKQEGGALANIDPAS